MSTDHIPGWIERITERALFLHKYILSPAMQESELRGKPWPLISAIEDYTEENGVPMLITRAKMELMRDLLSEMQPLPKVIIELGAYVGNSAVGWGAILRDLHGPDAEGLHVYTTELDPRIAQCASDLVSLSGLDDIVTVMAGAGSESINKLVQEGKVKPGELDVLFIDHWEKFYVPDLQLCEKLRLFHKGSLVLADNTEDPGAPTYVKYVKAGGSGEPGAVRYESKAHKVLREAEQSVVEVSTVVEA